MKTSLLLFFASVTLSLAQQPTGDGKTDDTAAIQALIDTKGSVQLGKGVYLITRTLKAELSKTGYAAITGDGTAKLVMEGAGPAIHIIGTHEGSAAPDSFKPTVWEKERSPMIDGIEIVGAHAEADGIEATGTMQLTLSRVVVRECRHAVHLTVRNRNVLISACHFYHNRGIGVFYDNVNLHQSNIDGSHISYNAGGGIVSRGGNVRNIHIGTCDIEGNHAKEGPPTANILLDSTSGSIGEVAITGCTIQHTSKAPHSANIRILGAGTDPSLERREGRASTREGNVTISANVFSDVQVNVEVRDSRGVVITGNTFWEGFEHDLTLQDCSNVIVANNNFDRNPRYLVNGFNNAEKNGIIIRRCEDSSFNSNTVRGVHGQRAAVDVSECRRMRITDNSVLDNDGAGIRLEKVRQSLVTGNLIRDDRKTMNKKDAPSLQVINSSDNVIEMNFLGSK